MIQNTEYGSKFTVNTHTPTTTDEPPPKKRKKDNHTPKKKAQELFEFETDYFQIVADQISTINALSKMRNHNSLFLIELPTLSLTILDSDDRTRFRLTGIQETQCQFSISYSLHMVNSAAPLSHYVSQTPSMRRLFAYVLGESSFLEKHSKLEPSITPQFFYETISKPSGVSAPKELSVPFLIPKLLRFQRESVRWCLRREGKDIMTDGCTVMDLDREIRDFLVSPPLGWSRTSLLVGNSYMEYWVNPYSGCICDEDTLRKFVASDSDGEHHGCGLLGEEMGLGKTVEILALVLLNARKGIYETSVENNSKTLSLKKTNDTEESEENKNIFLSEDTENVSRNNKPDTSMGLISDTLQQLQPEKNKAPVSKSYELEYSSLSSENLVYDTLLERTVYKTKTTLIISPTAICSQWVSEIRRHAPALKVGVYKGLKRKGSLTAVEMSQYDIIITTYSVIATEFHFAFFNPAARKTRNADSRSQDCDLRGLQSPLVQIQFWRVVLDEVQMVNSGVSNAARVAKIIPRVHAWGVTGTPVKGNMIDLQGLLIFLRQEPFASSPKVWSQLMALPLDFAKLFSTISIRHSMTQVEDDLVIPPQKRYLLSIPFNSVEENNYQHIFQNFLRDCGLDASGRPISDDVDARNDFSIDLANWLIRLRQACCHPRIGYGNRRALGGGALRTVDDVLQAMHEQTNAQLLQDRRKLFLSIIERGQLKEKMKDSTRALELWTEALKGVGPVVDSLRNEVAEKEELKAKMLAKQEEKRKQREIDSLSVNIDGVVKRDDDFGDDGYDPDEVVKTSKLRLRSWLEVLHRCYFLVASGHFQCYAKPEHIEIATKEKNGDEESATMTLKRLGVKTSTNSSSADKMKDESDTVDVKSMQNITDLTSDELEHQKQEQKFYNLAEILRRELLEDSISKAENLSKKLAKHIKIQHFVTLEDATIDSSVVLLGFESRSLFNKINELGICLNQQAEIIDEWRESLITLLGKPLVDKDADPDGEEYGESLDAQEYAFIYIEVLQQVLSDRAEAINGVSDPVVEGVQRATDSKSEYQLELEAERKRVKPIQVTFVGEAAFEFSLKGYLQSLKRISGNISFTASRSRAQMEQQLISNLAQRVQKLHDTQRAELRKLNRELALFRDLYNARVEYYKQLQELSDNVAEIEIGRQSIEVAFNKRVTEEQALSNIISQQMGRKRYLDLLNINKDPQESDRTCVICQTSFYIGSLTNCGHQFCRECLQEWWNSHRNCPLCKKKLSQTDVYVFSYRTKDATAIDLTPEWLSDESNESVARNGIYAAPSKQLLKEILKFDLEQKYGSKIDFLLKHIKWLLSKDPDVQIVVFSQWSEMLKLISMALTNQKIRFATMQNGVDEFRQNSAITCFLLHAKNES